MQGQQILTLKKDRLTLEVLALAMALTASILSLLPGDVAIEFADFVGVANLGRSAHTNGPPSAKATVGDCRCISDAFSLCRHCH